MSAEMELAKKYHLKTADHVAEVDCCTRDHAFGSLAQLAVTHARNADLLAAELLAAHARIERIGKALRDACDLALNVKTIDDRETYRAYIGELRRLAETAAQPAARVG